VEATKAPRLAQRWPPCHWLQANRRTTRYPCQPSLLLRIVQCKELQSFIGITRGHVHSTFKHKMRKIVIRLRSPRRPVQLQSLRTLNAKFIKLQMVKFCRLHLMTLQSELVHMRPRSTEPAPPAISSTPSFTAEMKFLLTLANTSGKQPTSEVSRRRTHNPRPRAHRPKLASKFFYSGGNVHSVSLRDR
jgi:hypothetical protein